MKQLIIQKLCMEISHGGGMRWWLVQRYTNKNGPPFARHLMIPGLRLHGCRYPLLYNNSQQPLVTNCFTHTSHLKTTLTGIFTNLGTARKARVTVTYQRNTKFYVHCFLIRVRELNKLGEV